MIGRGADAVGCAHCTRMGGSVECRVCRRIVCAACAADWTTCDQPAGRMIRLGLSGRLRDVDPRGRLALVAKFFGRLRVLDLRHLRWVRTADLPRLLHPEALVPRLSAAGTLWHPAWLVQAAADGSGGYLGLRGVSLTTGDRSMIYTAVPGHSTAVSRTDRVFSFVATEETVELIDLAGGDAVSVSPLPGKVVQAVHVDDERELIAAGTWGAIALYRYAGTTPGPAARIRTDGDVRWVATGGGVLAATITTSERRVRTELVAWSLGPDLMIGPELYRYPHGQRVASAALSRDGRHVVLGFDDGGVALHDLDAGTVSSFAEHTDVVSFARFVGDDHLLVTADDDNRVILRPRTAGGYTAAVIAVDIADEPLAITAALAGDGP